MTEQEATFTAPAIGTSTPTVTVQTATRQTCGFAFRQSRLAKVAEDGKVSMHHLIHRQDRLLLPFGKTFAKNKSIFKEIMVSIGWFNFEAQ